MRIILAVLSLVISMGSCGHNPKHPQGSILGRYELTGHDDSGRLVFTGTISLLSIERDHLKGQCFMAREKYAPEGLFEKNGGCEGSIDGKKVSIDFAPFLDDAGLLLEGEFDGRRINGSWMLDGIATSKPLGKFEALKKGE